jgi:hypothetical protein
MKSRRGGTKNSFSRCWSMTREHTTERAYWRYGYQSALEDVLEVAESNQGPNIGDFHN